MSGRHFYLDDTKDRVAREITELERTTSAEVVVVVRPASGYYRHVDYLVGTAFLFFGLLVFLFHPAPFRQDLFPLEALFLFVVGSTLSANVPDLRRSLTGRAFRRAAVEGAARAAMFSAGVTRTRSRTGVLVYVSLFEREVEVVVDVGLDAVTRDPAYPGVLGALESAVRPPDVEAFLRGLAALGRVLAAHCPYDSGDIDELPNAMHVS
jgi:putative membrane protein